MKTINRVGSGVASVLGWVLAVLAFAAPAEAQVFSLTPSAWSALTTGTDYTAAQLGVSNISGNSTLGASGKATFTTWTAAGETEPTGGQYAALGASAGFITLANNQTLRAMATADGSVFGGTTGAYTGTARWSVDVMFTCSNLAGLLQRNDSQIGELCIGNGSSAGIRLRWYLVNPSLITIPISGGSGTPVAGETITESTSGATARILEVYSTYLVMEKRNSTAFSGSLTLTGGTSGATRTGGTPVVSAQPGKRPGIKILPYPSSGATVNQALNGFGVNDLLDPEYEIGKVYTWTIEVTAGNGGTTSTGGVRVFCDRVLVAQYNGFDTNGGTPSLGTAGNTFNLTSYVGTGYVSGPTVTMRVLPRASVYSTSAWWTDLKQPACAVNTGTTRVYHTAFTAKGTETVGYPLTVTKVSGTPTVSATSYGVSTIYLGRSRLTSTGHAVGDVLRVSSAETLAGLETTADGDQYVGWTSEYIPTGSAVWGICSGADGTSYSIAVNYSAADWTMREGSTAGSGTILATLDPSKVYGVYLTGNVLRPDGDKYAARVTIVNLTDDLPRNKLINSYKLATAWPTTLGVMTGTYTYGPTAFEVSTMHAGRTPGCMIGDSFAASYAYQRGTVTIGVTGGSGTPAGTMTETGTGATATVTSTSVTSGVGYVTATLTGGAPFLGGGALTFSTTGTGYTGVVPVYSNAIVTGRNNVGMQLAYGCETHFLPNGYRPGKPLSTDIPDLVYAATVARSGRSVEQARATIEGLASVNNFGFIVPGPFAYNSMNSVSATAWETELNTWATNMAAMFNAITANRNSVIWLGGMANVTYTGNWAVAGGHNFMAKSVQTVRAKLTGPSGTPGRAWFYYGYDKSPACYVDATDSIHIAGDHLAGGARGAQFLVGDAFGNTAGGFTTGSLVKVAGK